MTSETGKTYRIFVFNQKPLGDIRREDVLEAISHSNFSTLCEQYGITPGLILSGKRSLDVVTASQGIAPYFLLHYRADRQNPLIVHEWNFDIALMKSNPGIFQEEISSKVFREQLLSSSHLVSIELNHSQLNDLGRLLAYELARWAAEKGSGLVRGLDGVWYRLNTHQAFLPIE